MLINRKSTPWFFISLAIFIIATAFFVPYSRGAFGRTGGGSWPGLVYGIVGSTAMLVTMFLAVRKRLRSWPLGRAFHWMQAHVWLGLVSYPLIIGHAGGLSWGGPLTQILMWLFTAVMVSGVVGIIVQQFIPTRLMREVPAETIYDQIDHVVNELREEAAAIVRPIIADGESAQAQPARSSQGGAIATLAPIKSAADPFEAFYTNQIVPFFARVRPARSVLAETRSAGDAFDQIRAKVSDDLEPAIAKLQSLVTERRQLIRQRRLHHWLHGWLLIHVPLSYAMVALAVIHAIMAWRFMSTSN